MESEYFYSKSTGLYVSKKPLKINSRVKKASEEKNINLTWDDEGRINYIDFDNSVKILRALDAQMMSPIQYWLILKDAWEEQDQGMINSLQSNEFCEWLNRVYLRTGSYIDSPEIASEYKYRGQEQASEFPHGRPGWFTPQGNIDYVKGLPINIDLFRDKFQNSWKYWSPDFSVTKLDALAPIRGYVTSVGKPSFDLGIPVDSKQPVQMVRECRTEPLQSDVDEEILEASDKIIEKYRSVVANLKLESVYLDLEKIEQKVRDFIIKYGSQFTSSKELYVYERREQLLNILGLLKLITSNNFEKESQVLSEIMSQKLKLQDFREFIFTSKKRLKNALLENKDIVFVMGHQNPDADTVISSVFEAWRNQLIDTDTEYIPVVQNNKIPDEIRELLGKDVSASLMLTTSDLYKDTLESGLARWISVDQNRDKNVQKYFISIIDHHVISDVASKQDIPKTLEMCGSCACLITNKFIGMGLTFDKELSKILYGATLLDTENRVEHKMTIKDFYTMDYLKKESGIEEDDQFYGDLMSYLLNTDDPSILFDRDYKEDWGFGFAVAKVRGCFDDRGTLLKKELFHKTKKLAEKNNIDKNLPLTILRITDYLDDCITVNRERVYLVFNNSATKEFIKSSYILLREIVEFEFGDSEIAQKDFEYLEFWGTGMQLSRKRTAPQFQPLVEAYNQYFYSPSIKKWIKRSFLQNTTYVKNVARKINIELSTDVEKRVNYITYSEAKSLLKELGYSMLSLKEYWLVLYDAQKIKDKQMIDSLQGSNFVEFLDTVIFNSEERVDHPDVMKNMNVFNGPKERTNIPKGSPGLIHPKDIDLNSGFPKIVRSPNEYGNPELWRYWEPDSQIVNPVRSYIFLLKQPCLDCKMHPQDSFPNLGIRPVVDQPQQPTVKVLIKDHKLLMSIVLEGDLLEYRWYK